MDLLLGGPGTGKTTTLVNKIRDKRPDHFALLSFTRQAAIEAKQRLSVYYDEKQLDWIRTIHSLAFKLLRLNRGSMFTDNHLKDFGNEYGFIFSNKYDHEEDGTTEGLTEDDITYRLLAIEETTGDRFTDDVDLESIGYMRNKYVEYKEDKGLLDFNDILKLCVHKSMPTFDELYIDEFQDCTPIQIKVIMELIKKSKNVTFAADDDQMIYEWAGVKRELFMNLAKQCNQEILIENHRLPQDIINKSQTIIDKCKDRIPKPSNISKKDYPAIKRVYDFWEIEKFDPNKSYLILARNNFFLKNIKNQLDDMGLQWNYLKAQKQCECNIKISTIHGSKGAEADVVILFTDVTNSTYQNITSDSEHRVFYVGVTRTRQELIIVESTSKYSYEL